MDSDSLLKKYFGHFFGGFWSILKKYGIIQYYIFRVS